MAEVTFSRKLAAKSVGTRALGICGPGPAAATFMIARSADVEMVDILSNPRSTAWLTNQEPGPGSS